MIEQEKIDKQFAIPFEKVLNRHGYGFQYSVLKKIQELHQNSKSRFAFEAAEFPVEVQGYDTRIDFILQKNLRKPYSTDALLLLAECKRANPALSNWCFVKAPYTHRNRWGNQEKIIIEGLYKTGNTPTESIESFSNENFVSLDAYHIGFEVRSGLKGNSSGETGGAIEKAASQISRGLNGFIKTMSELV